MQRARWLALPLTLAVALSASAQEGTFQSRSLTPETALKECLLKLGLLTPEAPIPPDLLERAYTAGLHSGKSSEVLPWIEHHLRKFKEDLLTWERLQERTRVPTGAVVSQVHACEAGKPAKLAGECPHAAHVVAHLGDDSLGSINRRGDQRDNH